MEIYNLPIFENVNQCDFFLKSLYVINKLAKKYRDIGFADFEMNTCYKIKEDALKTLLKYDIAPTGYHKFIFPGGKETYRICWRLDTYEFHGAAIRTSNKTGEPKTTSDILDEYESIYRYSFDNLDYLGEITGHIDSKIDKKAKVKNKINNIDEFAPYFKMVINSIYSGMDRDKMIIRYSKMRNIPEILENKVQKTIFDTDVMNMLSIG